MKKKLPADTWLWRFAIKFLARPYIRFHNITAIGLDRLPPPPYMLIGNHTHFLDPLFVGGLIKNPVAWVAAQGGFQTIYLAPFLKLLGTISKQKGVPDAMTIRQIYTTLKDGGIVGIYPEGSVTWDGNFGELPRGTEKLLDKVRVPIVAARIHGAYTAKPRWADRSNKCPIEIEFRVFDGREAIDYLKESEWSWHKKNGKLVTGKNKALGFQRLAWFCPECGRFRSIISKGNTARCDSCNYEMTIDNNMLVNGERIDDFVKNQKAVLQTTIDKSESLNMGKGTIREWDKNTGKFIEKNRGKIIIDKSGIKFGERLFELEKIKGLTTFIKRVDEFVYEDRIIRLKTEYSSFLIYNTLKTIMEATDKEQKPL